MKQSTIDMILKAHANGYSPEEAAKLLQQPLQLVRAVIETQRDKGPGF